MEHRPIRVLLVEGDEEDSIAARNYLAQIPSSDFDIEWAADSNAALDAIRTRSHDVCLLDYSLGGNNGLNLLRRMVQEDSGVPVIFVTERADRALDMQAMEAGACDYLSKDIIDARSLERSIRYAISDRRSAEALERAYEELERKVEERTRELRESEARELARRTELEALIEAIPSPVLFARDCECRLITGNRAARELLGVMEEHANLSASTQGPPEYEMRRNGIPIGPDEMPMQRTAATGLPVLNEELEIIRPEGSVSWIYSNTVPLLDERGKVRGCVCVSVDITERKQVEEELRRSELRFQSFFNLSLDGIFSVNPEGRFLRANPAAERISGYTEDELRDLTFLDICAPEYREESLAVFARGIATGQTNEIESALIHKNGQVIDVIVAGSPIIVSGGVEGIFCIARDITEQKKADQELRQSRDTLEAVLETAPAGIVVADETGRILLANSTTNRIFGGPVTGDAHGPRGGYRVSAIGDFPDSPVRLPLSLALDGQVVSNREILITRDDGTRTIILANATPLRSAGGEPCGAVTVFQDITERKRMEEELRQSRDELDMRVRERTADLRLANEKLQLVPCRLIEIQENERKRLASDLHDSIGQTLAALKYGVEHIAGTLKRGQSEEALKLLEDFVPILQRSIEETRTIYMGLRPTILTDHGILATVEWYRQQIMGIYPWLHIELEASIREEGIPENLKIPMFRIIQEALNNTCKHGRADWVNVRLSLNGENIELEISDDGVGMDLDYILESSTAKSLGLISMRERAELTGGELSIESKAGEGTTVKAVWARGGSAGRGVC